MKYKNETLPLLVIAFSLAVPNAIFAELQGTLVWNNQDQIDGVLVGSADNYLSWQTDLFEQPLEVGADYVSHLTLKTQKSDATNDETFRLETQFGDVLFGKLTAITDDYFEFSSQRFGTVKVRRAAVRGFRQLKHNKVVYDGPLWLDEWRVLKIGRELNEWEATDMGFLTTEKYGGEIYHDLPRLDHAEIHVAINWNSKPGFQIDFSPSADLVGTRSKAKLSIKSWGSDIVAQSSHGTASFVPLVKLSDNQEELRLTIIWDNTAGNVQIYSSSGRELAKLNVDKLTKSEAFGVLFKNRSDDLTIQKIRLSNWNGVRSSERVPGKPYARLADGKLVEQIESLSTGSKDVKISGGTSIGLDSIAIAEFIPSAKAAFQPAKIRFADGTVLSGDVTSIDETKITIDSNVLLEPISGSAIGLNGLRFFEGKTHEFDFEMLTNGRRLSGNIKPSTNQSAFGWTSVGCRNAVSFRPETKFVIERRLRDSGPADGESPAEVIYLKDGSVLLGNAKEMKQTDLVVSTPYTGQVDIPFDQLSAMEMIHGSGRASFTDANWDYLQDTKPDQRAPDQLVVSKTVSMQNAKLNHAGKLTFTCSWEEGFVGLLTIQLGESGKHVTRCSFSRDRVSARCLVNAASATSIPPIKERRANISIEAVDQRISIWVNGILASSAETGRDVSDTGIWIQCGSARHGRVTDEKGNAAPRLTVSRLRIGENASRLGAGFAAADELEMMLQLPRNKRRPPPQHVLCSTNRDLLRGKLLGLDGVNVQFASGYEEVELTREKVAAVVWLQKHTGTEAPAAPPVNTSTALWLRDGSVFRVDDLNMSADQLTGTHLAFGELSVPLAELWKIERNELQSAPTNLANWKMNLTKEPQLVSDTEQGVDSPLVGKDVSDLQLTMLEADPVSVRELKDQIIVLDFWASWCAPCVKSLPRIQAVIGEFPDDKVKLIGVNQGEAEFTIQTFLAHQDLDLEVALDPEGQFAKRFEVRSIPQTIVIGPKGKIARVFVGTPATLYSGLSDAIQALIAPTD